jgi:molecular chaperone DnaJ
MKGNEGEPGAPPGDLYVLLTVKDHDIFQRSGEDVILFMPISYAQACLGATIKVPTVDGATTMEIPPGTPSGKSFNIRGKGAPRLGGRKGRGDMIVEVEVHVPTKMSLDEEELVRQLAKIQEESVNQEKGFFQNIQDFWDKLTT